MIRKYVAGNELEDGERVLTANKDTVIRKDGERAVLRKGEKYIVSGYYEEFDEVEFITEPDMPVEKEDE